MLITSSTNTTKKISFTVQTKLLLEAIKYTDIALGTSAKPIPIDSFVSINDSELHEFLSGETIAFQLAPNNDSEDLELELVACNIHNVGQDFNNKFVTVPHPWKNILDVDKESILELPDGSLSIKPENGICSIEVSKGLDDKKLEAYLSYKVIFKTTISIKNRSGKEMLRTFYFVIDPLIKVTSGGKRGGFGIPPVTKYK
ncbi:hypothetical protein KORDIASMS9_02095 [Kordia sp. SMS9]|uniref:hypothetical protein n=1 Tax=Kordia sp. SMS9 TaxID=2282170 RepID=UPI000E0D3CD3|nr:hypothetical protein [Kordia sp. SMS9]AXG69867.1 hypothetical protein KORDIASMS9_02095 [Kordia sp. SMS9]